MIEAATFTLACVILLGLFFDFVNGFHDSANSIATVVSTRALTPTQAVIMAASLDFTGAFLFEGVAKTVSQGIVESNLVNDQTIVLTALIGATVWNLLTWWWGLPSSSSHALVGGLVGAALICGGIHAVNWYGVFMKVVVPGIVSPLLGLVGGFLVMVGLLWIFQKSVPGRIKHGFRWGQIGSAAMMALAHGTNDAQKVMGILTLALVAGRVQTDFHIPLWVKIGCAAMMSLGTLSGGWRIIKTLGGNLARLQPIHGFAAETTASLILFSTAWLGMPVSTTHVISSAIMGVGATKRLSAVRWTVAGNILGAWLLTLPAAAAVSAASFLCLRPFLPVTH